MRRKLIAALLIFMFTTIISVAIYTCKTPITTLSYYGSRGDEVINIQAKLKKWGYYKASIDGIYGYKTFSAVKWFQAKNGLRVDGVAGPETLGALALPTGRSLRPTNATSASRNINLLAHVIYGEARGEIYTGKVAIGAVVLNRVENSKFPQTIPGVIYQSGAFTAVADGQINLEPDNDSYNAARDALNGWDPTGGCIYYFNPATATSSWIWGRPQVLQIGKHIFAK